MNIDDQKNKLEITKSEIESEFKALGRPVSDGDFAVNIRNDESEHADPSDEANLVEEFEENLAVFNVLEERYAHVEKALTAIENNTYGICEVSGEKISEERLLANPSATTCIKHA